MIYKDNLPWDRVHGLYGPSSKSYWCMSSHSAGTANPFLEAAQAVSACSGQTRGVSSTFCCENYAGISEIKIN